MDADMREAPRRKRGGPGAVVIAIRGMEGFRVGVMKER
jgi:hypothetical protein